MAAHGNWKTTDIDSNANNQDLIAQIGDAILKHYRVWAVWMLDSIDVTGMNAGSMETSHYFFGLKSLRTDNTVRLY